MSKLEVSIPVGDNYFDFRVDEFAQVLEDAYLSLRRPPSSRAKISFAPSAIGYGSGRCARNWFYKFSGGIEQEDDIDVLQISNMENGKETHARIQSVFDKAGILIQEEQEIVSDDPPIRGFVDLVVDWDGPTVGEIKTMKQEAFTQRRVDRNPADYHVIQLLIYMKILKLDKGFLLCENKNSGEWLVFPVYMTENNRRIVDDAFEWMRMTYASYRDGELPLRPFEKTSNECKYCPFKKYCWKDDDGSNDLSPLKIE